MNVEGIRELRSSVRQGYASITLEFDLGREVDVAMPELQSYLSQVRLPPNVDPVRIFKSNPEDIPIMCIGSSDKRSMHALYVYADTKLLDRF